MATPTAAPPTNLLDPSFYVDPWAAYRWLRDEAPVYWDSVQQLWGISRFDDIVACEKDGGAYSSLQGSRPKIEQSHDTSMINMDEPEHQQQRNLVSRQFTPRAVRDHEDHVRQVVTEILDAVAPLGECEAIEAIASRLPAMMITELLGYPPELWEKVRHWSEQVMWGGGQTNPAGVPHAFPAEAMPVVQDFYMTTLPLVEARKAEPMEDLISTWSQQGWDDGKILSEILLVLSGGAETTRTVIGSMIRELSLQPDQRRILLEQPDVLGSTGVEEFIRWVSPVLNMRRTVTRDHELHGQSLKAGDELLLMYPSANRDPRAFDDPDVLDVTRAHNRHIAFGFGTHFCLGAQLARLEIRVMFEELLRRMPDWELVDPDEPKIVPATFARAYDRIRIRFSPS
jgi:cholest-4-en-3-one 26-monooxygenase